MIGNHNLGLLQPVQTSASRLICGYWKSYGSLGATLCTLKTVLVNKARDREGGLVLLPTLSSVLGP